MIVDSTTPVYVHSRWLHALAVLTAVLTLPLLFLGASVTSHDVGMVDPRGFRDPITIVNGLFENNGLGWRLEYGHRTFGFLVGLCGIGLAVGCLLHYRRGAMAWVGFLALTLICTQGALGIFRVDYNATHGRTFAMIHGVFAQIVFAVLVAVALFTSRSWSALAQPASLKLQRWSIVTTLVVFAQLLLGGLVRHQQDSLLGPRGHLLFAFVVAGVSVWLLKLMREENGRFTVQRITLMALLALQLWLGVESWLAKFHVASAANQDAIVPMPMHTEWLRTAHYLVGTLIFSMTVAVALAACRKPARVVVPEFAPSQNLEGVL